MRKLWKSLTVLVAGLSERFALGENNGNNEILEAGDIEEAGVLKILDIVVVHFRLIVVRHIQVCCVVADAGWEQTFI